MTERITLSDCKRAGFCVKGVRKFVEAAGMDFRDFIKDGISEEQALGIDGWQAMVKHVVKIKGTTRGEEKTRNYIL